MHRLYFTVVDGQYYAHATLEEMQSAAKLAEEAGHEVDIEIDIWTTPFKLPPLPAMFNNLKRGKNNT